MPVRINGEAVDTVTNKRCFFLLKVKKQEYFQIVSGFWFLRLSFLFYPKK